MLAGGGTDRPGLEGLPRRYRSIFISDVHLGTHGCKADCLLDFLRHVESDYLFLVGDIIDGWRLQKRSFWPDKHAEVLDRLFARARNGTEVVYLPGNHDEALRELIGSNVGGVKFRHDAIHDAADGRRLLVVHGDTFDGVVTDMRWLAVVGSVAYDLALIANTWLNMARGWLGLGYWPLSAFLKERVKAAVKFIDRYEHSLVREARRRRVAGVICGHVHKPEMRTIDGLLYYNDGDWVESCSALVEHPDGRFELLEWGRRRELGFFAPRRPTAAGRAGRSPATTRCGS
jgi:UDP-2,3-diacylglucosamine pyrophosphatase LpxH